MMDDTPKGYRFETDEERAQRTVAAEYIRSRPNDPVLLQAARLNEILIATLITRLGPERCAVPPDLHTCIVGWDDKRGVFVVRAT